MRHLLLAAVAAAAIATPAMARDGSAYVGLEGGLTKPSSSKIDGVVLFTDPTKIDLAADDIARQRRKVGYDIDGIIGYDFGMFRLEGEVGYKSARNKRLQVDQAWINGINAGQGNNLTEDDFNLRGRSSVFSGMINGLVDFGPDDGLNGYVGVGVGRAKVKMFGDSDSAWAGQLIAGVRMPVSDNIDLGVKYRYFRTGKLNYSDSFNFPAASLGGSPGTAFYESRTHWSSHSLLASVIFNFGAPAVVAEPVAPPPPPPAAPATQTCPDGSVILATDVCPAPPPPPPPAPVERGERGQ